VLKTDNFWRFWTLRDSTHAKWCRDYRPIRPALKRNLAKSLWLRNIKVSNNIG